MKKILFVCLGNICRSPAAEGVFTTLANQAGLDVEADSAGTAGWHRGEPADARMRAHAQKRGYRLDSRARQFDPSVDFEKFDLILAMDNQNYRDLKAMDRANKYGAKIKKMTDYCRIHNVDAVPDPYYGGTDGFEHVLDILEDACSVLTEQLHTA